MGSYGRDRRARFEWVRVERVIGHIMKEVSRILWGMRELHISVYRVRGVNGKVWLSMWNG